MKSKLFLLVILLVFFQSTIVFAQEKSVDIKKIFIGNIECLYRKTINLENNMTRYYVYMGFQNRKYKQITDIKSLFFTKQEEINGFIKDIKTALNEMGTKSNISWKKDLYKLDLFDFADELYIQEGENYGSGYTYLNKGEVEQLIMWLESFQIGIE